MEIRYCKACLFPETKPDLSFNDKEECSACSSSKNKDFEIDWGQRKLEFKKMHQCNDGEFVVNSVDCDGMINGFDKILYQNVSRLTSKPIVALGGAGMPSHFTEFVQANYKGALATASIYHFTQFTPQEVKKTLMRANIPVRI